MLKLIDITKEYMVEEESVLALHDVSIEFRKNEFVSILGPSGCGKTTTGRTIIRLYDPTAIQAAIFKSTTYPQKSTTTSIGTPIATAALASYFNPTTLFRT